MPQSKTCYWSDSSDVEVWSKKIFQTMRTQWSWIAFVDSPSKMWYLNVLISIHCQQLFWGSDLENHSLRESLRWSLDKFWQETAGLKCPILLGSLIRNLAKLLDHLVSCFFISNILLGPAFVYFSCFLISSKCRYDSVLKVAEALSNSSLLPQFPLKLEENPCVLCKEKLDDVSMSTLPLPTSL